MNRVIYPDIVYDWSNDDIIFKYRIKSMDFIDNSEVFGWASDNNITCTTISGYWYFLNEEDRILFQLRFQ